MILGRCPLSIFCYRGTLPTLELKPQPPMPHQVISKVLESAVRKPYRNGPACSLKPQQLQWRNVKPKPQPPMPQQVISKVQIGMGPAGELRYPSTSNLKSETRNSKPETRNPKPETRNPKPETRNPKPETRNQRPETRKPNPQPPIPKPQTPNPKP